MGHVSQNNQTQTVIEARAIILYTDSEYHYEQFLWKLFLLLIKIRTTYR